MAKILSQYSEEASALLRAFGVDEKNVKSFKFQMVANEKDLPTLTVEYYPDTDSIDTETIESIVKNYNLVEKENMLDVLSSLTKAAVGAVVQTPIAIVADIATLGGALVDKEQPFTATAVGNVVNNLENAVKPNKE